MQIKGESNLTISSLLNFQGALDLCCFGNGRATYKTELTEILSDYIIKKIVPPPGVFDSPELHMQSGFKNNTAFEYALH